MNDGLQDKDRTRLCVVIGANPKIRRTVLFGSRAMGTFRAASDIDLALEGENISLQDLLSLKAQISQLNLPVEVDLIVRATIDNADLEKHIETFGVEWRWQDPNRLAHGG